jgi:hypothetical protein
MKNKITQIRVRKGGHGGRLDSFGLKLGYVVIMLELHSITGGGERRDDCC